VIPFGHVSADLMDGIGVADKRAGAPVRGFPGSDRCALYQSVISGKNGMGVTRWPCTTARNCLRWFIGRTLAARPRTRHE